MKAVRHAWALMLLPGAVLGADVQTSLLPAGPQAAHIHTLWNLMLMVCTVVFIAVLIALGIALWRGPRSKEDTPADIEVMARKERIPHMSVIAATGLSTMLLIVLLVASIATDRAL